MILVKINQNTKLLKESGKTVKLQRAACDNFNLESGAMTVAHA